MSEYCVIGRHGFFGSAIAKRLGNVTPYPTKETKTLFHFQSHVHPDFERNPEYEMECVLRDFAKLLPYCQENGILFVYPSSALVYEKETAFARFKKTLEQLVGCYKTASLGLRIFPAYGPGETRTVISKWCRDMRAGKQPVVYGDGKQSRDFVFIDDAVDQILSLVKERRWSSSVRDIGSGNPTSFNEIVELVNKVLGTNHKPFYVPRPSPDYSDGIVCVNPLPTRISMEMGIRRIVDLNNY